MVVPLLPLEQTFKREAQKDLGGQNGDDPASADGGQESDEEYDSGSVASAEDLQPQEEAGSQAPGAQVKQAPPLVKVPTHRTIRVVPYVSQVKDPQPIDQVRPPSSILQS